MISTLYRLDLYIPEDNGRPCPVVAFVTGGAWIIGLVLMILKERRKTPTVILGDYFLLMSLLEFSYKAWGALLGRRLAERGIIVACIDYRF